MLRTIGSDICEQKRVNLKPNGLSETLSIITNFGCKYDCWYCIWKVHKLENCRDDTNWILLEKELKKHRKISISGGGDCLYNFDLNENWWKKLFEITKPLNILVDIHSRTPLVNNKFWSKINKCVFSSDRLTDYEKIHLRYILSVTKLRITHVVTSGTTDKIIEEYLDFQHKYNCQFTIKELYGFSDNNKYKEIKQKYPEIYALDQDDYNIYYMPNNTLTTTFL